MKENIISILRESADLKVKFAKESIGNVIVAVEMINKCIKAGGKLLIFGNGGSASDSQHIAAEFVNRFYINRKALPAIALTTDGSVLTSVANDDSFDAVFSRQVEALGKKNDIVIAITTSGKSQNIINGLDTSKKMGLQTITLAGQNITKLRKLSDCIISVPSKSTPRIQEVHITIAHILCELVENNFSEE
ncbi:MAG: D-sedoheptulose-7-phosphate isomerase [Thermodesulfobacteriota bacterium]